MWTARCLCPNISITILCAFPSRILCGGCATHCICPGSRHCCENAFRWAQDLQLLLVPQQCRKNQAHTHAAFATCPPWVQCASLSGTEYDECAEEYHYAVVFLNQSYPTTLTYGYSNSLPSTETLYTVTFYTCMLLQGQLVWELVLTMLLEG